jgi:hypothetical protein
MGTWTAFIGEWPPGRVHTDVNGLTWTEARDVLLGFIREELDGDDVCEHCATEARRGEAELTALAEGTPWTGSLDWDDLRLVNEGAS